MPAHDEATTLRERVPLTLAVDVLAWVRDRSQPGGPFGTASHACELALARLRDELREYQVECKRRGIPFRTAAFWKLHEADLLRTAPTKRDPRPREARPEPGVVRERIFASLATELIAWAQKALLDAGPLASMSQAVELGLLRLQVEEARLKATAASLGVPPPAVFWRTSGEAA